MAWKTMDIQEQRVRFVVEAAADKQSMRALCAEFGISRPTGYLWLNRYRVTGLSGIAEHSRRPHRSPQQTSESIEAEVVQLRLRYPDWGARKLCVLLARQGIELPATTVHRILLRHDLVQDADRHSPALKRFERERPNELWQMDFKGPRGWRHPVGPLSVIDDHSRYLIALSATGSTHAAPVREQLEKAFIDCGLPEGMLMDHGVPWWSTQAPSGSTSLALWLMRQGIGLHWSRIRHPQTQGKVERFHGSLMRALNKRGTPRHDTQKWLDDYRWEHNHIRPHEALGMQTPASVWQPSPRHYDPQPPRWEYPEGAWALKVDCQGKIDTRGRKWKISRALAGDWVRLLPIEDRILVYYCNTLVREIDFSIQRTTIVARWIESSTNIQM
jgi:transposase InsO family protein